VNRATLPGIVAAFVVPVVAAALAIVAAGCTARGISSVVLGPNGVLIPPVTRPRARMPSAPIPADFKVPPGKGPFPAVIVLHGCGGRGASQLLWADRLNEWGYAALIPDSMAPRGIKRVCESEAQHLVTPRDRMGDVGSAVAWLRSRPEIDPDRIAVLGESHGGATAALATARVYGDIGLTAAVDYYGACIDPGSHGTVPLLALAGEADDWGFPAVRCRAYASAVGGGQTVDVHTYPGVYHAFENPRVAGTISNRHLLKYDRDAAEDSFVQTRAFLDHWVKR
jgi:dienelactone hydrolase